MEPKQNYLMVGVFVIATMIGIICFMIWIAGLGEKGDFKTYQTFVSESVNGLTVGSTVKYRGVDVGKVTHIALSRRTPDTVRIVMDVDEYTPITQGTVAVLQMQGITGIAYIELRGDAKGGPIPLIGRNQIPIIPSAPSEFRQIVDTVPDMLEKFTELADKLGEFASEENQESFREILVNLENFSNDVGGKNENGETLVQELRRTADEVKLAASSIKYVARNDVQDVLKTSNATLAKISKLTDSTDELTQQGYQDLQELLLEIKKTARELQDLSRELKDNPSQIIIPEKGGGIRVPKN